MSHAAVFFLLLVAPALALVLALLGLETLKSNALGWLLLAIGTAYPAGAVIHFWILKRPFWETKDGGRAIAEEKGDRSFWLILPGMLATFFVPPLEYLYLASFMPRTVWMQFAGLVLIVAAIGLRLGTRAAMRGQYSGHIQVTERHQFIQSGPYRYVRHPGYAAYFLMVLGICLGYSSLIGLAAIPILLLPGFAYRLEVEERLLAEAFGSDYEAYLRSTRRILPGIW
jgi:protein-S-isoprenylcysteine O-methyltransferase Ste14